jgi:hypothetical protein
MITSIWVRFLFTVVIADAGRHQLQPPVACWGIHTHHSLELAHLSFHLESGTRLGLWQHGM